MPMDSDTEGTNTVRMKEFEENSRNNPTPVSSGRMAFLEDYVIVNIPILPEDNGSRRVAIKIINEQSLAFDMTFRINGVTANEETANDDGLVLAIDFDILDESNDYEVVINPEPGTEKYNAILQDLGDCVVDFIAMSNFVNDEVEEQTNNNE